MFKKLTLAALGLAAVAGSFVITAPAHAQYYIHRHYWQHERHVCFRNGGLWDHGVCVFPRQTGYRYGIYRAHPVGEGYWRDGRFYYYNR